MGLLKHLQFLVYLTIAIICHFARAGHEITDEPISPDQCTLLTECEELKGLVTEKALENLCQFIFVSSLFLREIAKYNSPVEFE